jgi:hypothetical protein
VLSRVIVRFAQGHAEGDNDDDGDNDGDGDNDEQYILSPARKLEWRRPRSPRDCGNLVLLGGMVVMSIVCGLDTCGAHNDCRTS